MKLVKLNAIDSTSSYLKQLSKNNLLENWTVVSAEFQNTGRGQTNTKWYSDEGKNLIVSILIKFDSLNIKHQFYLNCAISLGIYAALNAYNIPKLSVKWPNDIMAGKKKLGGILIENSLINTKIYQSVIGIGLNINQEEFPDGLPNAISLKQLFKKDFDKFRLLEKIVESIQIFIQKLNLQQYDELLESYLKVLFQYNKPQMFELKDYTFLGKITGVSKTGKIIIENEKEIATTYDFKEIKYLL